MSDFKHVTLEEMRSLLEASNQVIGKANAQMEEMLQDGECKHGPEMGLVIALAVNTNTMLTVMVDYLIGRDAAELSQDGQGPKESQ